ncbi:uncharacterized protein LOC111340387 [Stylophora pistillata]|uniref:uncharacterized protein LOC111340387 n=1 Tax=Stylophora pistillata TaxID=50429 RepID=UPI000C05155A|nr:uncharacterized protein LOC111340387 [Stylophora pistillata]
MDDPMLQATTSSLTSDSTPKGTSTKETTNYARLCRLLIDVGSQAPRDIFNSIHPPASLRAVLEVNRPTLQKLRSRRVLNATQWSKLYPAIATSVSSANFDITLIFVLLRNICGLNPPATTGSWDILPPTREPSAEADIVRLKCFRNDIYAHAERASLSDFQFASHWQEISETLVRLGGKSYESAINNLKTESIDPEMEVHYKKVLEEWKKNEDNVKGMLDEIKREVGNVSQKVDDLTAAVVPNRGNVTIKIVIEVDRVTFKDTKQWDPAQQEEVRRKLMSEMSKTFFETRADRIAIEDIPSHLQNYLESVLDLPIVTAMEGSLILTVHCRTLEILERLWKEYCSGHLNAVAEKFFMTDDIQERFDVDSITLKTTILKEEYLACKLSLMDLADF